MRTELRVAVLGAGRIGRKHAETLAHDVAGVRVAWVAEPLEAAGRALADELGARWTPDPSEAVTDGSIQAVAISTPTNTHAELVELAAGAGKAIFCEKPIDLTMERTLRAIDAAERAGVPLQIGFQRRYDPAYERARALIEQDKVGKVELVTATSRDPEPASIEYLKGSGGIFCDLAIHDFDIIRYLTGDEVASVFAYGAAPRGPAHRRDRRRRYDGGRASVRQRRPWRSHELTARGLRLRRDHRGLRVGRQGARGGRQRHRRAALHQGRREPRLPVLVPPAVRRGLRPGGRRLRRLRTRGPGSRGDRRGRPRRPGDRRGRDPLLREGRPVTVESRPEAGARR